MQCRLKDTYGHTTVEIDEEILKRARDEASRRGTTVERLTAERVKEISASAFQKQSITMQELIAFSRENPLSFLESKIPNREERTAR